MNKSKNHLIVAAMFIAGMLGTITGCSTAGLQAGDASYSSSPYLIVDDSSLANQIGIEKVAHDMVGDIMRASVTLKSNRSRSLQIQYRFSWYDANGMEIDGNSKPYRDLVIEGKDSKNVTSMAPSPAAQEFKIRVRKVKAIKIENVL